MKKHTEKELIENEGIVHTGKLNQVEYTTTVRKNGSKRIQSDYQNCPSMADQHSALETDINYLIKKFQPDELAQYIAARSQNRQEIKGYDFASEPSLQDGMNYVYSLKQKYSALPDEVKNHFKNVTEFLKFIDNPANAQKMVRLGLLTKKQVETITTPPAATTQEAANTKE